MNSESIDQSALSWNDELIERITKIRKQRLDFFEDNGHCSSGSENEDSDNESVSETIVHEEALDTCDVEMHDRSDKDNRDCDGGRNRDHDEANGEANENPYTFTENGEVDPRYVQLLDTYPLSEEEIVFARYCMDRPFFNDFPDSMSTTDFFWPNYRMDNISRAKNDYIRSMRKSAMKNATTFSKINWQGAVSEHFSREQIKGRPMLVHCKINICQFARERYSSQRNPLLPPMHWNELSPIDRGLIFALDSRYRRKLYHIDNEASIALGFEAYHRNVVAGSSLSQDASRNYLSNWGTEAVSQRVYLCESSLLLAAHKYLMKCQEDVGPSEANEEQLFSHACDFIDYLLEQKRVIERLSTFGAQQLVSEIVARVMKLIAWVCSSRGERLNYRVNYLTHLLRRATSSTPQPIDPNGSFHKHFGTSGDHFVYARIANIVVPRKSQSEQSTPLVCVLGFPLDRFKEETNGLYPDKDDADSLFGFSEQGWEFASAVSSSREVEMPVDTVAQRLCDPSFRYFAPCPFLELHEAVRSPYNTRLLRESDDDESFDVAVALSVLAVEGGEIAKDPEGIGELASLVLHSEESAAPSFLYKSSAWIAMSLSMEDAIEVAKESSYLSQSKFFKLMVSSYNSLQEQENEYDEDIEPLDPGHQAVASGAVAPYIGKARTLHGKRIQEPPASRVYLEREPALRWTGKVGAKLVSLRVSEGRLRMRLRDKARGKVASFMPQEIQLSVKLATAKWVRTPHVDANLNDGDFNRVLSGEYGDSASLWLLSNVFAGNLKVSSSSEVQCFFPASALGEGGYRCWTPLKESVASSLTYFWHEASNSLYWSPFEVGSVFHVLEAHGGMYPLKEMEYTQQGVEELRTVSLTLSKCIG